MRITKTILIRIGILGVLIAGFFFALKLNTYFGHRIGEIDKGYWHVMKKSRENETWIQRGVGPDNIYLDSLLAQDMDEMFKQLPNHVETRQGYGAIYYNIGRLNDARLGSSGWHLFSSEKEAVEFLRRNSVEDNRIYFIYR